MPDPVFTPLAAFGLASAILGHLISTAQNLHGKYHEIKDFPDVFQRYARTVNVCRQSYDLWWRLWHRPDENSYNDLFGDAGWAVIKGCKQDVWSLIVQITDILCLCSPQTPQVGEGSVATARPGTVRRALSSVKSVLTHPTRRFISHFKNTEANGGLKDIPAGLEPDDRLEWQKLRDTLEDSLSTYKPEELVLKRILGVLGPNQNLKNKVSDLEKAVDNLEKQTTKAYQIMGHGQEPKNADEVDAAENRIRFRAVARDLVGLIRAQNTRNKENPAWFLELQFPNGASDGSGAVAQIIKDCSISLVARAMLPDGSTRTREIKMARLKGILALEDPNTSELAVAVADFHTKANWTVSMPNQPSSPVFQFDWSESPPNLFMKDWRTLLGKCSEDAAARKALELERARLALGLTLWFILLWETEWFGHVCSCAFRCVLFPQQAADARRDSGAGAGPGVRGESYRQEHIYATLKLDPNSNAASTPIAHDAQALPQNNPAAVLASCRGQAELKDRLYHLGILLAELALAEPIHLTSDRGQMRGSNSPGRPIGKFSRVRDIRNDNHMPSQLKGAIGFCFEEARKERWMTEDRGLAADRLRGFLEDVVKPVKEYHDVVEKNFKEHYARKFLTFAYDYQDDDYEDFEDSRE